MPRQFSDEEINQLSINKTEREQIALINSVKEIASLVSDNTEALEKLNTVIRNLESDRNFYSADAIYIPKQFKVRADSLSNFEKKVDELGIQKKDAITEAINNWLTLKKIDEISSRNSVQIKTDVFRLQFLKVVVNFFNLETNENENSGFFDIEIKRPDSIHNLNWVKIIKTISEFGQINYEFKIDPAFDRK